MTVAFGCQARQDFTEPGTLRCIKCRLSWDRDEASPCPRQVVPDTTPLKFASGLPFSENIR